jgi:hypothetical protein
MVEPDAPKAIPELTGYTSQIKSVFDPVTSKIGVANLNCPPVQLPALKMGPMTLFPAQPLSLHCDMIEPNRGVLAGGLTVLGSWIGAQVVMKA